MRVLLIEDDPSTARSIELMLKSESFNVYTTDLDAFEKSKDIRKRFYGDSLPAATWVQVQRLFLPSLVVEVELIAEYPKN